jgi:RNA polymerase sigma factor (sigma-70 family)
VGDFWFTTLSAVRRGEPDWAAIEPYESPVRRFLAARYPALQAADRDDLVQEILLAMREKLVRGYDPGRGPFRALLRTAIANKVRDRFRRRRAAPLEDEMACAEPSEADAAALDLDAEIVRAVRAVHDRHARGEAQLVYALAGVLVDGLSEREIARREGLSADQVKRLLGRARGEILAAIFERQLGSAGAARAAELARACLREPRREARLLEDESHPLAREAAAALVARIRAPRSGGEDDFLRGLRAVFEARE